MVDFFLFLRIKSECTSRPLHSSLDDSIRVCNLYRVGGQQYFMQRCLENRSSKYFPVYNATFCSKIWNHFSHLFHSENLPPLPSIWVPFLQFFQADWLKVIHVKIRWKID